MVNITRYLDVMIKHSASDLFFSAGAPVLIKINGVSSPLDKQHVLSASETKELAFGLMNDVQRKQLDERMNTSFGVSVASVGRFRVSVFIQRGSVAMVIRRVNIVPPTLAQLNLPSVLGELVLEKRGLILVSGATGSGKSSTLAAMIEHRNSLLPGHILTIEDPIEYLFSYNKSVINQREVGVDTPSYAEALRSAMREAPDVIMIGEIRDEETMRQAIVYSETGHLCLATIHASNAIETLDRVINFFEQSKRTQVLLDLSRNLLSVVCQRLVPSKQGSLVPAIEMMRNTPYFRDLIEKGKVGELTEAFDRNLDDGIVTFDRALIGLYRDGMITQEQAIHFADSKHNVELQIRLDKPSTGNDSEMSISE